VPPRAPTETNINPK